jgi:hypothetical protein
MVGACCVFGDNEVLLNIDGVADAILKVLRAG